MIVCAATAGELAAFPSETGGITRVVSGVGVPATLATLIPLCEKSPPDSILNIGIAGAYPDSGIRIGDIVYGTEDVYGDIGFELPHEPGFRSITDSDFGAFYTIYPLPLSSLPLSETSAESLTDLRVHFGRGCTVNSCTGTMATGLRRAQQFHAVFETMEGAAVGQVGQSYLIPTGQIRAISNIAGDRDMQPENIRLAIGNLKRFLSVLFT